MNPVLTFLFASFLLPASRDPASIEGAVTAGDVVGGQQATAGEWPDVAAVYFGQDQGCSGVLVAPDVVITAGHCAGGITSVKLGATDLSQAGEVIQAKQVIAYQSSQNSYDITVVILDHAAQAQPRLIAQGCALRKYLKNGAPVEIVGYGAVDIWGNEYPGELREAATTVTDYDCRELDRGCEPSVSPGGEIGAGGKGIDACYGDSGGPLYLRTPKGDFVVGITSRSWGDLSRQDPPCREGGIYVRPDAVVDWIEQQTGRDLPEPICNLAPAPTAAEIDTDEGVAGTTTVDPNDPDDGDTFTYAVTTAAEHGTVDVAANGTATFTPEDGYAGDDHFVVTVSDNGDPVLTGQVDVHVTVTAAGGGGCSVGGAATGGAGLGAGLLALATLLATGYRRRRRGMDLLSR